MSRVVRGRFSHGGAELVFELDGPAGAPAVVFTHGALLDRTSWAGQQATLRDRFKIVTWDLPGHGDSDPLPAYPRDALGLALLGLMDHLGLERAALVGLSVGGWVAQWVTHRAPERVDALACLDTTDLFEPTLPGVALAGLRRSAPMTRWLPFGALRRALPFLLSTTHEGRQHARERAEATEREAFLGFWAGASQLVRPEAGRPCPVPLLIACGARDRVANIPKYARRWAEREPHAELAILPGAGHLANLDAPDAVDALLLRFLERHLGG